MEREVHLLQDKFGGMLVCAWNRHMDIKHWSREGRQTFHAADTLLQRHDGVLFLLGRIITYIHDMENSHD